MLVLSHAAIARLQFGKPVEQILVGRVNHRQHGNAVIGDLAVDKGFVQQLNRLWQAVAFTRYGKDIHAPVTQGLNVFVNGGAAHSQPFTKLFTGMKIAVGQNGDQLEGDGMIFHVMVSTAFTSP